MSRAAHREAVLMEICMSRFDCRLQRNGGYSYLWLLLLIALLGVGLVKVVEIESQAQKRDKETELLFIGAQFSLALESYWRHSPRPEAGERPSTLQDLLLDQRGGVPRRHLRKIFVDPMTGSDQWGLIYVGGRIVAVHSRSEKRPLKQDQFPPEQAEFAGKSMYSQWLFGRNRDVMSGGMDSGVPSKNPGDPARPTPPLYK